MRSRSWEEAGRSLEGGREGRHLEDQAVDLGRLLLRSADEAVVGKGVAEGLVAIDEAIDGGLVGGYAAVCVAVVECVDVLESERGGRESEARRDQADRLRRRLGDHAHRHAGHSCNSSLGSGCESLRRRGERDERAELFELLTFGLVAYAFIRREADCRQRCSLGLSC